MSFRSITNTIWKTLFRATPFSGARGNERLEKAVWMSRFERWCSRYDVPVSHYRPAIYQDLVGETPELTEQIDYLEFGVFQGRTIKWWLELNPHPTSRFFGFDTFQGLPEAWDRGGLKAGDFDTGRQFPEVIDTRCEFIQGTFQETLPGFLKSHSLEARKVIHLDADLYSSTLFVLMQLAPLLRKGDYLIFDEFQVYLDEFKAWQDFLSAYPLEYEVLRRSPDWSQTVIRLLSNHPKFEI